MRYHLPRFIFHVIIFVSIGLGAGIVAANWTLPSGPSTGTTVAPSPPPQHIEWDYRQVGGFILLNPAITDSLGRHPGLTLPEGAVLGVPHLVAGDDGTTS